MKFTRRRFFSGLAALFAAGSGGLFARGAAARYYEGPISDHFDGVRFVDPLGMPPKRLADVLWWYTHNNKARWPEWRPSPFSDRPPHRVGNPELRISYVGHASLLIQSTNLNILIDPVWSERASPVAFAGPKRVNEPGIDFDALPPIDVVLVSHCHYDHLDLPTLSRLAALHRPRVITPLGNGSIMKNHDSAIRAEEFDWDDRVELGPKMAVTLAPMRHWSARSLTDRNKALWAAFVIETSAGRIYHVADSGYGNGFRFREARDRYGPFRLAILPIGAYEPRWFMRDQHMNPEEALKAFVDCGADYALGHHYGTFQLTDEEIDAPVQALTTARAASGIAADRFRILQPGQAWEL